MYIIPHGYNAVKSVIKGDGFSELGRLNQLKEIADNVIPNLSRGFLNLGRSVKSLVTHTGTFKDNIKAAGTNFKEFFSTNKVALFISAIMAIVAVLNTITNAANENREALRKKYESDVDKAEEQLKDTKETNVQLSEIIDNYKKINAENTNGVAKRKQLKSLQEQLNELLGKEASGVDVVNGKLSTQLTTLKNINKEYANKQYSDTISAAKAQSLTSDTDVYHNAPNIPFLSDIFPFLKGSNDWFSDERDYTFKVDDKDAENIEKIKNSVEKVGIVLSDYTGGAVRTEDPWVALSLDRDASMAEIKDIFDKAIKQLNEDGLGNTEFAKELSRIYTDMFGKGSNFEKTVSYYQDALNTATLLSEDVQSAENESVKSYEDYLDIRNRVIRELQEDYPELQEAVNDGWLTESDIAEAIDRRFQGYNNFKDYFVGNDVIHTIQQIQILFSKRGLDEAGKKEFKEADEWLNNLSPDDKTLIYQIGIDTTTARWKLDDWKNALDEAKKEAEKDAKETENAISKIFSSKESENGDTFLARIKTYRENINSLTEALEKYKNGELDEDAFHGLVEKFPQLVGRTTDLDVAITELMDDMDSTMVSDFDNQFGKLDTQEDIDALKEYESQVLSTRETAAKFQSDIENLVSVFGTVKSAVEEYNENGFLSLSSLQSILSLNDKYISALTNEQGALDLSTESYKKLVEAELIELKAQTLQNSLDTVRNIDNRTEALAYLNEREHSAAQASLDLADAQWQEALSAAAVKDIQQGTGDLYQRTVIAARKAYDTRIALIDEYAKTTFTIGELSTATDEYSKALNNEKEALENSKKALEDQKNALEETKQGYEDALSAVKDLVSWVQDYIKQIKNDEIDALEKKKESIDKLIESQKELLDAEQEEYEWNKTIAEKQNTVAKDALAASIASLDDSSAGRKAQKQANDKLAESRTDMQDALYEHEIEQRKEALDKLKEEQDEYYDNLIKEIQDYLGNEVQLYKDACSMIDNDSGDLYGKLLWYCRNYTTTTEAEFNHMWNSAQSAMEQYNAANLGTFELLNNLQGRIYEVDGAIDAITQSISSYESAIGGVQSKLDDLSKQAQRTIADVRAAANAEDEWSKPKWIYSWQGNDYKSWKSDRDAAISDIIKQIESRYGGRFPASAATIYGTIRKYASGTNYATGGLSLVGERGAEFKVLNTGDGIVKNQIVKGITALGTNPAQFIADAGKLLMKNLFGGALNRSVEAIRSNNQIAPSIHINVQGDATQSTVDALKAQAKKIMNDTIKTIRSDTLMKTYSSRVR